MREILFRGKRLSDGKWLEGYYVRILNPLAEDGKPERHFIYDGTPFNQVINPKTLGQYTGFLDKNANRIYEGDIIKDTSDDAIGVVAFGDYSSPCNDEFTHNIGFYLKWEEKYRKSLRKDLGFFCIYGSFEVIGNIHDNPELIEHLKGSI